MRTRVASSVVLSLALLPQLIKILVEYLVQGSDSEWLVQESGHPDSIRKQQVIQGAVYGLEKRPHILAATQ